MHSIASRDKNCLKDNILIAAIPAIFRMGPGLSHAKAIKRSLTEPGLKPLSPYHRFCYVKRPKTINHMMTENRKLCLRYRLVRHAKQRISTKISELAYSQILRQ